MRISSDVHVNTGDIIDSGHKPGIIRIGGLTLYFAEMLWGDGSTSEMEALRDECQSQLEALKAQRAQPVAVPADPVSLSTLTPEQLALVGWLAPANAPIEELVGSLSDYVVRGCSHSNHQGAFCRLPENHEGDHAWSELTRPVPHGEGTPQLLESSPLIDKWLGDNVETKTEDGVKMFRLKQPDAHDATCMCPACNIPF